MKELFEALTHKKMDDPTAKNLVLIDTCFLIHTFEHQKESQLKELIAAGSVGITSFNAAEFVLKEHDVDEKVRESMRKLLKKHPQITIIDVPAVPGDREGEKRFVNSVDSGLLAEIPDASDAVLIAAAIKTGSTVLTKDKHHLFTTKLENYLHKYNIEVHKEYHDVLGKQ